jgi:hypothetical protein
VTPVVIGLVVTMIINVTIRFETSVFMGHSIIVPRPSTDGPLHVVRNSECVPR